MRPLLLTLATSLLFAVPAQAEEPTGFDGFAFGTARSAMAEPLRARCRAKPELSPASASGPRLTCPNYALKGFGAVTVALLFSPDDRLEGFVVYIPEARYQDARARISSQYGPPTRTWEQGRTLSWRWASGANASLTDLCVGKQGCLTVRARDARDVPRIR